MFTYANYYLLWWWIASDYAHNVAPILYAFAPQQLFYDIECLYLCKVIFDSI